MKSLIQVVGLENKIVKAIDYDENGNIIFDTNPNFDVPFGFAGGLYDKENKLLYFSSRTWNNLVNKRANQREYCIFRVFGNYFEK